MTKLNHINLICTMKNAELSSLQALLMHTG